jgi:hypothetical protein
MMMFECDLEANKSALEFSRFCFIKNADNRANLTKADRIRNTIVQFGACCGPIWLSQRICNELQRFWVRNIWIAFSQSWTKVAAHRFGLIYTVHDALNARKLITALALPTKCWMECLIELWSIFTLPKRAQAADNANRDNWHALSKVSQELLDRMPTKNSDFELRENATEITLVLRQSLLQGHPTSLHRHPNNLQGLLVCGRLSSVDCSRVIQWSLIWYAHNWWGTRMASRGGGARFLYGDLPLWSPLLGDGYTARAHRSHQQAWNQASQHLLPDIPHLQAENRSGLLAHHADLTPSAPSL